MALYVSIAARRRRTVVIAVLTGVIALALGWLIGRQQVPSIDERVVAIEARAADIATGVERLDIEYEQVLAGAGDTAEAGVIAPLDGLRQQLVANLEQAPWITQDERTALIDQFVELESAARRSTPLDDYRRLLLDAGTSVRTTFGVGTSG